MECKEGSIQKLLEPGLGCCPHFMLLLQHLLFTAHQLRQYCSLWKHMAANLHLPNLTPNNFGLQKKHIFSLNSSLKKKKSKTLMNKLPIKGGSPT